MSTTDIELRNPSVPTAADMRASMDYAKALATSGLLPDAYRQQPQNVLYAIEYGRTLGITPMAAITGVHIIKGKPTASAALISALVRRAGHKLRVKGDARSATAQIIRSDDPDYVFESTFTIEDAKRAGLLNKETWQSYPGAMLKSRAITQVARDACEEALFGLHYTPEELGASVDEEGLPVISVEQAAEKARRSQHAEAGPWDASAPSDPPHDASREKPTDAMLQRIAILVTEKFGTVKREERLAHLSQLLGGAISSMRDLSLAQARGVISDLEELPDHIADAEVVEEPQEPAPNPRNGESGKPLDPALFVPSLRVLVNDASAEGGVSVYDALRDRIGKATTTPELQALWRVANEARKDDEVSTQEFDRLDALSKERNAQLSGAAPAEPSDAPSAEQYEVRDRFTQRIKRAKGDDFNELMGSLIEARDAQTITSIQYQGLLKELDARYEALRQAAGEPPPEQGWSHQRLDEMAGAGGGR